MKICHTAIILYCLAYISGEEPPNCAAVQCLAPQCTKCEIPVRFYGACCSVCREILGTNASYLAPPSTDCPKIHCPLIQCADDEQALAEPNKCCPTVCVSTKVKPDCRLVDCAPVFCTKGASQVRFRNRCCRTCLEVGTNATYLAPTIQCPHVKCNESQEALAETGKCCATVCVTKPKHSCSVVRECRTGEIPVRFRDQRHQQCVTVSGTNATSLSPPPDCPLLNCLSGAEALAENGRCCASQCVTRPCMNVH